MQEVNVLVAGDGISLSQIKKSKYLKKLYVTSDKETEGAINIGFNTFKELAQKCKALQIDIVLAEEEKWVLQGIADVLKSNLINCIAPTTMWTELALSNIYTRNLAQKYEIDVPKFIKLPVEFPVILKTDKFSKPAYSIQELTDIRKDLTLNYPYLAETAYTEAFIEGEKCVLTSIFDGKHLLTFPENNINEELIREYTQKLETMLVKESANFTGFINSEIIAKQDKLYLAGYNFKYTNPKYYGDFLYLLISAVYQKLNEIVL